MKRWEKTLLKITKSAIPEKYVSETINKIKKSYQANTTKIIPLHNTSLSNLWFELGKDINYLNYALASECYEHCVAIDPNNSPGWYALADSIPHTEKALSAINNYLKLAPHDSNGWLSRGIVLSLLNQNEEAVLSFDEALKCDQKNSSAYYNKITSLLELKEYHHCIKCIELTESLYDSSALPPEEESQAHISLYHAQALSGIKCYEESIKHFDKYLEFQEYRDTEVLLKKGMALKALFRADEARSCFKGALEHALEKAKKGSYAWISSDWLDLAKCFFHFKEYRSSYICLLLYTAT